MDELTRDLLKQAPLLAVWAAGLSLALLKWRHHPSISALVTASCALSIVTTVALTVMIHRMPEAARFGLGIGSAWACQSALSTGMLLWAAFRPRRAVPDTLRQSASR